MLSSQLTTELEQKSLNIYRNIFSIGFFIALFNIVKTSGSISFLLYLVPLLALGIFLQTKKRITIPSYLYLFTLTPIIFISCNELLLHSQYNEYSNSYHYFFLIFLLLLPYVLNQLKIKLLDIYIICLIITFFSLIFHTYMNFKFNFSRGLLSQELSPIIIYNFSIVFISLIPIIYNSHKKTKFSLFLTIICLLNIITICLQGSRGVWLALICLSIFTIVFQFKKYKRLIGFTLTTAFLSIITLSIVIDNSPIENRISAFNSDLSSQQSDNFDQTSVGLRVTMYKAALENFTVSPIYGIGDTASQHQVFLKTGINPHHLHHVFLNDLSSHGLLGLLGIGSLFLIPFYISMRVKNKNSINQNLVLLHHIISALILFTMLCGLTDHLFNFKIALYLYCFVIVTLLTIQYSEYKSCPTLTKEA